MKTQKAQKKTRRPRTPRIINMDALLERARTRNTPQAPVVGRFVVLQSPSASSALQQVEGDLLGTYPDIDAVTKAIFADTKDMFEASNLDGAELGPNAGYAGVYFICQVIAAQKVIPDVHVIYRSEPALPPTK